MSVSRMTGIAPGAFLGRAGPSSPTSAGLEGAASQGCDQDETGKDEAVEA